MGVGSNPVGTTIGDSGYVNLNTCRLAYFAAYNEGGGEHEFTYDEGLGAYLIPAAEMQYLPGDLLTVEGASDETATSMTFNADIVFRTTNNKGNIDVRVPSGTVVTRNGGTFDATSLTIENIQEEIDPQTIYEGMILPQAAVNFGFSSEVSFSRPITITMAVDYMLPDAQPLALDRSTDSGMTWTVGGFTASASDTCTNGQGSNQATTTTISEGAVTMYSCSSAYLVAYKEIPTNEEDDYVVSPEDTIYLGMAGIISISGDNPMSTTSVTFNDNVVIAYESQYGEADVMLKDGTVITRAEGGLFNALDLTTDDVFSDVVATTISESAVVRGAVEFGFQAFNVYFSQPVGVWFPVDSSLNGDTLSIVRSPDSGASWTNTGLTAAETDSCSGGIGSNPITTGVVGAEFENYLPIYTCRASYFAAYNETPPEGITFNDAGFEACIRSALSISEPTPITEEDAATLSYIYCPSAGISDTTGLEYFTNITWLYLGNNNLSSIDVSANTALTTLELGSNDLTTIDVSSNTALTTLNLYDNDLTGLDVSANTDLEHLVINSNSLTALDVSQNTALQDLVVSTNALTELDVSASTALTQLIASGNNLTSVDVSNNTALVDLYLPNNSLTSIDVSNNIALSNLYLYGNSLTEISSLVENEGLTGSGDTVNLTGNSLQLAAYRDIATLEARDVNMTYDTYSGHLFTWDDDLAAYIVTPDEFTYVPTSELVTIAGADPSAATSVTFNYAVVVEYNNGLGVIYVTIPEGTVITKSGEGTFDATTLTAGDVIGYIVPTTITESAAVQGAVKFGYSSSGVYFSTPITISVPVNEGLNGETVNIVRSADAGETWESTGLTEADSDTCVAGTGSNPVSTALVSGGYVSLNTCRASYFAVYKNLEFDEEAGGYVVEPGDLNSLVYSPLVEVAGGDPTNTESVTFTEPVITSYESESGAISITIPTGTVITSADGEPFDATTLTTADVVGTVVANTIARGADVAGAIEFGYTSANVFFSTPVTLVLPVDDSLNGQLLYIVRSPDGGETWTDEGLTASASDTCDAEGNGSDPVSTALVSDGTVTLYTCRASYFASYEEGNAAPRHDLGGGGGGATGPSVTEILVDKNMTVPLSTSATNVVLVKTGVMNFTSSGVNHQITLKNVDWTGQSASLQSVTLQISSNPINIEIKVNKTAQVDLNADGVNDIEISLTEITSVNSVKLTAKLLPGAAIILPGTEQPGVIETPESPVIPEISLSSIPVRGTVVDLEKEKSAIVDFAKLTRKLPANGTWSVIHYVVYGTAESKGLTQKARQSLINDFYEVYGRVPSNEKDWMSLAQITLGIKPDQILPGSEKKAVQEFIRIYKRIPDLKDVEDQTAINFITYRLMQVNRDLAAEKQALNVFSKIYRMLPSTGKYWAILRAIAYSGVK